MKRLACVLAALATIAVAAPTVASAQGFSVRLAVTAITIATVTIVTIADRAQNSMDTIAGCIAAGTIMMATAL